MCINVPWNYMASDNKMKCQQTSYDSCVDPGVHCSSNVWSCCRSYFEHFRGMFTFHQVTWASSIEGFFDCGQTLKDATVDLRVSSCSCHIIILIYWLNPVNIWKFSGKFWMANRRDMTSCLNQIWWNKRYVSQHFWRFPCNSNYFWDFGSGFPAPSDFITITPQHEINIYDHIGNWSHWR